MGRHELTLAWTTSPNPAIKQLPLPWFANSERVVIPICLHQCRMGFVRAMTACFNTDFLPLRSQLLFFTFMVLNDNCRSSENGGESLEGRESCLLVFYDGGRIRVIGF